MLSSFHTQLLPLFSTWSFTSKLFKKVRERLKIADNKCTNQIVCSRKSVWKFRKSTCCYWNNAFTFHYSARVSTELLSGVSSPWYIYSGSEVCNLRWRLGGCTRECHWFNHTEVHATLRCVEKLKQHEWNLHNS